MDVIFSTIAVACFSRPTTSCSPACKPMAKPRVLVCSCIVFFLCMFMYSVFVHAKGYANTTEIRAKPSNLVTSHAAALGRQTTHLLIIFSIRHNTQQRLSVIHCGLTIKYESRRENK